MDAYTSLRDAEFKLYGEIVQLRSIANRLQIAGTESLSDLEAMVIGHRFRVAVVGEFNRGKSTAINALLGAEVLPASIEACSAALNRVTYGQQVTARVVLRGEGPTEARSEQVPLDELVAYVTKLSPDAARMSSSVEEAVITYPSRFCRNNVDLIDTPGLNDEPTMTAVTMRALGRIHAAVVVIRAAFSFSHSEQLLLEKLLSHDVTNILFLVTAIDELDELDQPRVVRETRNRILKALQQYADDIYEEGTEEYDTFLARFGQPQVYGVAALMALEAKSGGSIDVALEQASGYPAFETALESLLTGREGAVAVTQIGRKLLKVCDQIDRAIHERGALDAQEQASFGSGHSELHQLIDTAIAEAQRFAAELQHDADDVEFRVRQHIAHHSSHLEAAAREQLANLPIEARDVVAVAGRIWRDPNRPAQVPPNYRAWAVGVAKAANGLGVTQIENLVQTLHERLAVAWQELIASIVRQIFVETNALRERAEVQRTTWFDTIKARLNQLNPEIASSFTQMSTLAPIDRTALAAARSGIVLQMTSAPPTLQVQPTMVAMRAVAGLAGSTSAQTDLDEFRRSFQILCQRAIAGGLEASHVQRVAQLEPLAVHTAHITASIVHVTTVTLQQLSTLKQSLTDYHMRRQHQIDAHHMIAQQQLEQLSQQVITIKHTTTGILDFMEESGH